MRACTGKRFSDGRFCRARARVAITTDGSYTDNGRGVTHRHTHTHTHARKSCDGEVVCRDLSVYGRVLYYRERGREGRLTYTYNIYIYACVCVRDEGGARNITWTIRRLIKKNVAAIIVESRRYYVRFRECPSAARVEFSPFVTRHARRVQLPK